MEQQRIEHLVLFKCKPGLDDARMKKMKQGMDQLKEGLA